MLAWMAFPQHEGDGRGTELFVICVHVHPLLVHTRVVGKRIPVKVEDILGSLDLRSPSDEQMSFDNFLALVLL